MSVAQLNQLVTADEFVTALLCGMALKDRKNFKLNEAEEDQKFAKAFEELQNRQAEIGVDLNFAMNASPYHGDSSTLREALYSLRERNVVAINNPSFRTVEIKWTSDLAEKYLERSPLSKSFISELVDNHFGETV